VQQSTNVPIGPMVVVAEDATCLSDGVEQQSSRNGGQGLRPHIVAQGSCSVPPSYLSK
jgi:hypothetical protein